MQNERSNQVRCLLDILEQCNKIDAYEKFVDALRCHHPWLADKLEQPGSPEDVDHVDMSDRENHRLYTNALALGNVPWVPTFYIVRTKEIEKVQSALIKMQEGHCLALVGMTGCGKSVLASAAVRDQKFLQEYFGLSVFWLGAGEARSIEEASILLHRLGRMLNPEFVRESDHLMRTELSRTLAAPKYNKTLIILDDVCSHDVLNLFDLNCKMLVTTQELDLVKGRTNATVLEISSGFILEETLELFSRITDVPAKKLPSEAKQIHELCKGAPLTISLLATMMEPHKHEANKTDRWKYYIDLIKDKHDDG